MLRRLILALMIAAALLATPAPAEAGPLRWLGRGIKAIGRGAARLATAPARAVTRRRAYVRQYVDANGRRVIVWRRAGCR